jgi:hypothetical protein
MAHQLCFHPILAILGQRGAKYQKYSSKESTFFRIGSYNAGKLEGLKAPKLPGFLAYWPSSLQATLIC